MIYRSWWMNSCATLLCLWQEAGENLALFCYRMVWGTFSNIRAGAFAPILAPIRTNAECLTPSSSSSMRCSTLRD